MPHPPWSTNHRPRGQVLQSARSPALHSPRSCESQDSLARLLPQHTHTCTHTHTQSHSHRPVREVSRRTWVLSTHPERSPGPSSPRAGGFRGFRRLRLEALPLPDPSPPGRAAAKVKDHLLLRPEKQRHWRAPAPRDCGHTAPASGPFTPQKRVADLCPAGLPPLSPEGEASPLGRRPPSRRGGAQLPNGSPGLQAHSHHSPAVAPL